VWDHASDGLVEDTGGSTEVEWTTAGRVVTGDLAEVGVVLDCSGGQYGRTSSILRYADVDVRFARKNSPEMLRASQRTTTIFCPFRSCLATVLARRPSK
jgi:hypothetical protein